MGGRVLTIALLLVSSCSPRAQVTGLGAAAVADPGRRVAAGDVPKVDDVAASAVALQQQQHHHNHHHQQATFIEDDGFPPAPVVTGAPLLPSLPAPEAPQRAEQRRRHGRKGHRPDKHGRHRQHDGHGQEQHQDRHHGRKKMKQPEVEKKRQRHHGGGGGDEGGGRRQGAAEAEGAGGRKHRGHKKNNKTLPDDQQIRHHKQRRSRRKQAAAAAGAAGASRRANDTLPPPPPAPAPAPPAPLPGPGSGSTPTNTTFRRRSEEKQELLGRRTLQVLSPAPTRPRPSPTLVGILDIAVTGQPGRPGAGPTPAPASARTTAVAAVDDAPTTLAPAVSFKAKGGRHGGHGGRGRIRPTPGEVDVDGRPLDPEWLQRLLAAAGAAAITSSSGLEAHGADEFASPCDRWMACSAKLRPVMWAQLAALPACPCTFPANVFYYNKIWDEKQGRYFRWRDASGRGERLDVYHPGAAHCIRSLHTANAGLLAAQQCCYDRNRQLLTRGSGAGTPALMSPDVSAALHGILDIRPWRICKGDFTRYNEVRPPNNDNHCAANPDEDEFQRQVEQAQFF